ncbi:phosphate ABC transporter permease PstA [Haliea sp. E1-2-M8]|nr:phosphate ABC transporter permease PstA [Haliea sp. E1-2-M8]MDO8863925.1 phosphate ABC transporter permease PstA [Haliea sp. E1-2-M8]
MINEQELHSDRAPGVKSWLRSGEPLIWLNGAAVSVSVIAVMGLLLLLAVRGLSHFWPADVLAVTVSYQDQSRELLGEVVEEVEVVGTQLEGAGIELQGPGPFYQRTLLKQGNRDFLGTDFTWLINEQFGERRFPSDALVIERLEWGDFYGYLRGVSRFNTPEVTVAEEGPELTWQALQELIAETDAVREQIRQIERVEIGAINYELERLRLRERELEMDGALDAAAQADLASLRAEQEARFRVLQEELYVLYDSIKDHSYSAELADGRVVTLPIAKVVRAYQPNAMSIPAKVGLYFERLWEFLSAEPREANTEGGIFPAMFGTVLMVILMSIIVTPFGVVAAVYLREYASQGFITRTIRIAVNNLAGVPSIVYGVFGLGFFIYFVGGELDQLFFPAALPRPTFGTPGLMWASLTLALLTLPVVIVATEEGLSRIPKSLREGSLALGATRAETLWRVVLPMASPAMMTGLILAVARAAGEVAPLMLVGVVKLAPTLPLDGNYPYLHLDQKFMHLGFHIYDVGFQSPNVEAARPLVYATALLLVLIIALLNLAAVSLRNRLRERYKSLEH